MEQRFKHGDEVICTTDEFTSVSDCDLFSFAVPKQNDIYHVDHYHPDSNRFIILKDGGGSHCWDESGFELTESESDINILVNEFK